MRPLLRAASAASGAIADVIMMPARVDHSLSVRVRDSQVELCLECGPGAGRTDVMCEQRRPQLG